MSDSVDLMLDGVICQYCGQFIGDPTGVPRSCGGCEEPGVTACRTLEPLSAESGERPINESDDDDDLPF